MLKKITLMLITNIIVQQGLCGQHQFRIERRHDQASFLAIWTDQVHQYVLGSRYAEAQGLRLCRIRDTRSRATRFGTNEWCHDRWPKHQGSGTYLYNEFPVPQQSYHPAGGRQIFI